MTTPASPPPSKPVVDAFNAFDDALLLDPSQRRAAIDRHNAVSAALTATTRFTGSFLQGSFTRKTMLKPLTDVDVIAVFNGTALTDPRAALDAVRAPILAKFPGAEFDRDKTPAKAVKVTFPGVTFAIDITVAVPDPFDADMVRLANRNTGRWEHSATRRVIRLVRERNKATQGQFIHQVRMLKAAKDQSDAFASLLDGKAVCGLLIESLAYEAIGTSMPHPTAVARVLSHAAMACRNAVYDPARETDLTAAWAAPVRATIVREFERLAAEAAHAIAHDQQGRPDDALTVWAGMFGDEFPAPTRTEHDIVSGLFGGAGITSTGRITTSPVAGEHRVRPTRPWLDR